MAPTTGSMSKDDEGTSTPPRWQSLVKEIRLLLQGSVRLLANFKKMGKAKFTEENAEDRLNKLNETWARCEALNLELELLLPDAERMECPSSPKRNSSGPRTNIGRHGIFYGRSSGRSKRRHHPDRRRPPAGNAARALRACRPSLCRNSQVRTRSGRAFATCSRRWSSGTRPSAMRHDCSICSRRWRAGRPSRSPTLPSPRPISAPRGQL